MTSATLPAATTAEAPTTDWAPVRALLEAQRARCVAERELALTETVASVPDPVAVRRAATLLHTIEEIDAARERLDTGTYGHCVPCGRPIPLERLESRPFATGCVSCQELAR
jgi:DnaK suppressor protein